MSATTHKTTLSTSDVARLFSVTETTVKRWADDGALRCQKTPGGHRKFEIRNVVEFAEKNHFEPAGILAIPANDRLARRIQVAVLARDHAELVAAFVEKALSPDTTDLFLYISYLYQHRVQLWEIYDLIIRPGMEAVGERWAKGEIGVNHEHRASYETLEALAGLQAQIHRRPPTGRSALCSCLEDDLHEIGLRCACYMFESEGWTTTYLGARTPHAAVMSAIREMRPDVVSISVSYIQEQCVPLNELAEIVGAARRCEARVVLGGRMARAMTPVAGLDAVLGSGRELQQYVETFGRDSGQ
ncbi:MAG: cobalamin-dependent protein [Bacteroidota bacterium]